MLRPSRQIWTYTVVDLMRQGRIGVMTMDGEDGAAAGIARLTDGLPERPSDLPLERCSVPVGAEAEAAISQAWRAMLEDIGSEQETGLDGVSYRFSMTAEGRPIAGEVWSPRPGSRTFTLARMADVMRAYCETREQGRLQEVLTLARALSPRPARDESRSREPKP